MKFYQTEINTYEEKVALMRRVQDQLDVAGLAPEMPAICISLKKAIMLTNQLDVKKVKDKDGVEREQVKIAGYMGDRDGGRWYPVEDLAPFTDASRILYLK